jgi:hypothetical protein
MGPTKQDRRDLIAMVRGPLIFLLIFGVYAGPELLEPKEFIQCESVTVISFRLGMFNRQYFTVAPVESGRTREVGAANAPFGHEYRGHAVLALRRWTGRERWRLYTSCPTSDA